MIQNLHFRRIRNTQPAAVTGSTVAALLTVMSSLPVLASPPGPPSAGEICRTEYGCNNLTLFFWSPPRNCAPPPSGSHFVSSLVPNNASIIPASGLKRPNRFSLANEKPGRTLQVLGRNNKDVMVGSPGDADILDGSGGGGDTFVVGNGNTGLIQNSGAGDNVLQVVSTSNEADAVILTTGASPISEYIYISTAREITPGTVSLSASPGYAMSVALWGAGQIRIIANSIPPSPTNCISGALLPLALTNPLVQGTMIAMAGSPMAGVMLPQITRQATRFVSQTNLFSPDLRTAPAGIDINRLKPCRTFDACVGSAIPPFQGVPIVKGIQINGPSSDQLILQADDYPGALPAGQRPKLEQQLKRNPRVPIRIVRDVKVAASATAPTPGMAIQRPGLTEGLARDQAPTRQFPFFYFPSNGLLVYSRNEKPLGSSGNPGRIVAQLLDSTGRPVNLPTEGASPVHVASFLAFDPITPDPNRECRSAKGTDC
jgi:hypothetical protein